MSLSNFINRLADTAGNVSNTVLNSVSNLLGKTEAQSSAAEKTSKSYFADWYSKFMAQTPAAKTDVYRQVFIPQAAKLDFTDNDVKAQLKQEAAKYYFSGEDNNKQSAAIANTSGVDKSNGNGGETEIFVVGLRKSPLDAGEISEAVIKQLKFTAQDIKDYQAKYGKDPRTDIYNIINHCLIDPRCKKEGLENFPKPAKSGELLSAPHNVAVENIPISVTKPLHDFIKTQREQQTAEYAAKRQNLKDNSPALIARDTGKQIAETVKRSAPTLVATTTAGLGTAADLVLRQPIPLPTVADIAKNMKLVIGGGGALLEAAPPVAAGTVLVTGAVATGKQYLDGQVDNKLDEIAKANRERMLAEPLPPFTMTMDDAEPLPQPIPDGKTKERPFAEPSAPTIPNIETAPPKAGDLVKPETKAKPETTIDDLPQPFTPDAPREQPPLQQPPQMPKLPKGVPEIIAGAGSATIGKLAADTINSSGETTTVSSSAETRAKFKEMFGEARYNRAAREVEIVKSYRPELKNIPTEDLVAVRGYTGEDHYEINQALRTKDKTELERLDPYIKCAASGLDQMPLHQGTVYRGTDLSSSEAKKYKKGVVVTEQAFTSSSYDEYEAFDGNTKFIIDSASGKDVSFISEHSDESEVLFKPGTKFEVLDVQIHPRTGKRLIFMQEIKK